MSAAAVLHGRAAVSDQLAFLGYGPDDLVEVQALHVDGRPRNNHSIVVVASDLDTVGHPSALGVYLVINKVDPKVLASRPRKYQQMKTGKSTRDADIVSRRALCLDFDAERPDRKASATDAEVARARAIADEAHAYLVAAGIPARSIAVVESGNGRQLWIALDSLPATDDVDALIVRVVEGVAARFSSSDVKVDTSVTDRKRILPLAGTWKRKGTSTSDRPHRRVTFTGTRDPHRLSVEELRTLADKLVPPAPAEKPTETTALICSRANTVPIRDVMRWLNLDERACPGCGSTTGADPFDVGNGFKCFHNRCSTSGKPPGFRSPVDVTCLVRGVGPIEAAHEIVKRFYPEQPKAKVLGRLARRIERLGSTGPRLRTGFPTFDAACRGGLPVGRVVVVGGAPGAAKTTTVAQWALTWAKQGVPVAFLAADEEADGILVRWGQQCGISLDDLDGDKIKPATRARLSGELAGYPINLVDSEDDDETITIDRVSRELAELRGDGPASVLIVDSIQIAATDDSARIDNPRERIDAVVRALKRAAKRDGHLVIATSELARGAYRDENTINPLAAFKESGSIEYGVGTALVLRTVGDEPGLIDVEVPKNRIGRSADAKKPFRLRLDFDRAALREVPPPTPKSAEDVENAIDAAIFDVVNETALYTASAVYDALQARGQGARKQAVLNRVRALRDEGALSGGTNKPFKDNRPR